MLFKRINRSDPEKIFIVVKNSYAAASVTNGQALMWNYATDADGVGVTLPAAGTGRAAHYGLAFAGVAAETIAAGAYGLSQVYGYHSAVRVRSNTGANPTIAAGPALTCKSAVFCLESGPAECCWCDLDGHRQQLPVGRLRAGRAGDLDDEGSRGFLESPVI